MNNTLYDKLVQLNESEEYPFHMPGHKRNVSRENLQEPFFTEIMGMDITEIEGFDNLHHPEGIIKEEQDFAANLYGARKTFYLVNGSTCGVLSAICGCLGEGEKIVLARNSHKSAYNGIYLKNLEAYFVYPWQNSEKPDFCGPVRAQDVARQMDETGAKVCFITSPTYEGILSDIEEIAKMVHEREGILIVDEAHGAHLGFHSYFPESAVTKGADLVVQSLHKTLPSMTQTALLHICSNRVKESEIRKYLGIFQSSSPSYILMASMSKCIHFLAEKKDSYFADYADRLENFYQTAKSLKNISVLTKEEVTGLFHAQMDPSKLNLCTENLFDEKGIKYGGKELARDLIKIYRLQPEMVSENYVIAMTSIFDTEEGFQRLLKALMEIDGKLHREDKESSAKKPDTDRRKEKELERTKRKEQKEEREKETERETEKGTQKGTEEIISIRNAMDGKTKSVLWKEAKGEISAEYLYLYPPGSPIIVPGERIRSEIWEKIEQYRKSGLNVQGPVDYSLNYIQVMD